jgi:hypothetical protein
VFYPAYETMTGKNGHPARSGQPPRP